MLNDDAEATTHAWVDVWLHAEGRWLSCDVTHRELAAATQVRLAVGRDYLDASPVRGMRRGGGKEQLEVQVAVHEAAVVPADTRRATIQHQNGQQ
jgi:transglutaminase-like putative cysteine protease